MTIEFEFQAEGILLKAKASGRDDNLADVQNYGMAMLAFALEHSCTKVLCDERDLIYTIATFDIYASAKQMAEVTPKLAQVAIIFNPSFEADAKFWETVAVNRGLQVSFFQNMEDATHWLEN